MKAVHNEFIFIEQINDGFLRIDENGKIWRIAIRSRKGKYTVIPEREMTCKNNGGYIVLSLHKNGKQYTCSASRLVWIYFNGEIPEDLQINHKNGIKTDNSLENLEIVTKSENEKHAYRIGLKHSQKGQKHPAIQGEKHPQSKLTESDIRQIRLRLQNGETQKSIALDFNITRWNISCISNKRTWSHIE